MLKIAQLRIKELENQTLELEIACAALLAQREASRKQSDALNEKLLSIRETLYGQNLMVANWHSNDDLEPLDTWFEDNDWAPLAEVGKTEEVA
jgi:hypothetical protein